jgi:ubiquinone/menaquinone biosynthesis C-methylase UbiE
MESDPREKFYSYWSTLYALTFENPPVIRKIRRKAAEELDLEKGDRVVEIGCGTGANFRHLRSEVGEEGDIVGIDLSEGMLEKAEKKVEKHGWENVELIQANASEFELEEEFDAAYLSFSVMLFDNPAEVMEKWSENLEEGKIGILDEYYSEKSLAPLLNPFIELFNILTAPPTFKVRYNPSLIETAKKQSQRMEDRLEEISEEKEEKNLL